MDRPTAPRDGGTLSRIGPRGGPPRGSPEGTGSIGIFGGPEVRYGRNGMVWGAVTCPAATDLHALAITYGGAFNFSWFDCSYDF